MKMKLKRVRPLTLAVPSLAFAVGIVATASIAFAATLSVTSSPLTTHSSSVAIAESSCTVTASADAALDRATQGSNYGGLNTMSVRNQSGNNQRRTILRFNIASCNIPTSALVRSADLTLTVTSGPGATRNYTIHRVNATPAWGENTVTYQNQPAFNATATSTVATGTAPSSLSWSVLTDVSAFVANPANNNGWLLRDTNETANPARETIFSSREAASPAARPTLVIAYYP
jgi:hypothetical protein